ncbi:MAG: flavodoxin [Saccharofermentans sp.]|nr:flavodoxin [Saccharofermentans sp.]
MAKTLITFFSRAGENYLNGNVEKLTVGNTEVAADLIAEFVEADKFKIDMVQPYPENYTDCTAKAKLDQGSNVRPEIKGDINVEDYDVIYLGFPNYWGTMPMAVFTFLEKHNWEGKIIKPFVTHEGSGFGEALDDITKVCVGATVKEGISIHGADVRGYKFSIRRWVNKED